jgi:hypothetical protein
VEQNINYKATLYVIFSIIMLLRSFNTYFLSYIVLYKISYLVIFVILLLFLSELYGQIWHILLFLMIYMHESKDVCVYNYIII